MRSVPTLTLLALIACTNGEKDATDAVADDPQADGDTDTDADTDTDTDADADTDSDTDTDTTADTGAEEICDGLDNNGDGVVDEGFEDFDTDTIADCVDTDCDAVTSPLPVVLASCTSPFVATGRYTVGTGANIMVNASVKVGLVVDHNGDGVVDALDSSTLVVPHSGSLDLYDAATGVLDLSIPGEFMKNGGAVADVDGDGDSEVLALLQPDVAVNEWTVVAYDGSGTVVWQTPPHEINGNVVYDDSIGQITVADLDGDGTTEVLCDGWVYDGATGGYLFDLAIPIPGYETSTLVIADLDLDGSAEIIHSGYVFDHTGQLAWDSGLDTAPALTVVGAYGAPAQLDADPEAEVVFVASGWLGTNGSVYAYEHDGTPIGTPWATGGSEFGGPPCVVDLDADGLSEVGVVFGLAVELFDSDGTTLWSHPIAGGLQGCSAFDFDADGTSEILVGGRDRFVILDGTTGALLYEDTTFSSGETFLTSPMAVDVDADGRTEVVAVGGVGFDGYVRVYEHVLGGWPGSGPSWGISDFAVGRVSDLGAVDLPPYWAESGYRARPATTDLPVVVDLEGVDLRVDPIGGCAASCTTGPQKFVLQVSNQGALDAPAGVLLELLTESGAVVGSELLPDIPSGGAVESTITVASPALLQGTLYARIDSTGELCDTYDDRVAVVDAICP